METSVATLDKGATCSSYNFSGVRLAAGTVDGNVSIYDVGDPSASSFSFTLKFKVDDSGVIKIVWLPPEYGDAIACICQDGALSLWEEVSDGQALKWKLCKSFKSNMTRVLDLQYGVSRKSLRMVVAYSDGHVRVFELMDPLELKNWQLQAEFQNVVDPVSTLGQTSCLSASVCWNPRKGTNQESSFVLGLKSDMPQLNSAKVWEFDEAHNRWLPVAELASHEDRGDEVHTVSWAPNIGRSFDIIAVATPKGIAIWRVGLTPDLDGRLSVEKVALLSGHQSEVVEMKWDMFGMTLATAGADGLVKLWQSNLNGAWQEQATLEPTP